MIARRKVAKLALSVPLLAGLPWVSRQAFAQAKPVVMGAPMSLTGAYSRLAEEYLRGLQMWREEVNARGGLLGRPVEFKIYDDQSDPTTATKLFEKLIADDKVDLALCPFSSPVTFAASTVTEKYKYPIVAGGATAQNIWERGYKYIFQMYPPPDLQIRGLLEVAKQGGVKSAAVIGEDTIFTKELSQIFVRLAKEGGVEVVFYEEYGKGMTDLTPVVLKARAKRPDMIFGATYLPESVLIMRHLKELNFAPKIVSFLIGPALDDYVKTLGKDAEYAVGTTLWESTLPIPGVKEFVAKYRSKYRDVPPYHVAGAYGQGLIVEEAVKKAGTFDREKLRDALASLETTTIFGGYKVNAKGVQTAKQAYIVQIQEGRRKLIWPSELAEAKLKAPLPAWNAR